MAESAILDFVKKLAAELEIVALLVDAPTAVADDVNPVLDVREKLLDRDLFLARFKRNIRHPLQGDFVPTIRESARVRLAAANPGSLAEHRLIIREAPVFDDMKLGAF